MYAGQRAQRVCSPPVQVMERRHAAAEEAEELASDGGARTHTRGMLGAFLLRSGGTCCSATPVLHSAKSCGADPHLSALLRAGHGGTESGHSHSLPNMRTFGGGPAGDGPGHGKSTLAAKVLAGQSCRRDL